MRHTLWLLALAAAPVLAAGDDLAVGKALFVNGAVPACAVCHTLKDAGTTGEVGPALDELKPSADRVAAALRNGVGLMPSYKDSLTDTQIRAIARYVASVSGQ
jgi:sulfite dehydrogenase